jgi:ribosomal protein bL25 (Ctc-form)
MAEQVVLQAEKRTVTGKAVRHLRQEGKLPANLTGRKQEAEAIQINAHDFEKLLKAHGRTTIFTLSIAPSAKTQNVVIGRVSRDPISGAIEHIDFRHVAMNELMRARVPLQVVGESPSVKAKEGILLHLMNVIEVEALPANLPEAIEVTAYYVVSEAMTNAAKYAHASGVQVTVEVRDQLLRVSVRDDGQGGADPDGGSGLVGLKDRAEAMGGTLSLQSHPGAGTSLQVDLPLDAATT